jgi:PHS family inorganic phosphate transporter-like MFS transporter
MIKKGATHDNPTPWIHGVMQIFALFMFLGMLTSLLVPESRRRRLEEIAGEKGDVYELQFRSGFFRGEGRKRSSLKGDYEVSRGGVSVHNGKWWKLG